MEPKGFAFAVSLYQSLSGAGLRTFLWGKSMLEDYIEAKRLGDWAYRRALLFGNYPYLPALDDMLKPENVQGENPIGTLEIPLSDIVGTKSPGRQQAFAMNFMPILGQKTEFATKWSALYDSAVKDGIRDPILVYEYLKKFYVQEGNKRVSVMKYNGAVSIPASVIRVMPVRTEDEQNRLYYEFVDFFRCARIYRISFSECGSYEKLTELLGKKPGEIWSEELSRDVKAAYDRFSELYLARGGGKLSITVGDAFLTYLNIYGLSGILDLSGPEIRLNLDRLWREYLKSAGEITLIETPDELKRSADLRSLFSRDRREELRIAFLYERRVENSSWAYGHELGRLYVEEKFGPAIRSSRYEDCDTDEKTAAAIDKAVGEGCGLIFTTGGMMIEESLKAAIRYPTVHFMNCSVNQTHNSIRSYYGRMYEAKFLMGALAASISEGQEIGYVERCPLYGTMANINAFAIGAQLVNPWVRICLRWSGLKKEDWREVFRERRITTISGPEYARPGGNPREFGLYVSMDGDVLSNVAAPVFDWGKYYEIIIRSVLEGSYGENRLAKSHQALNYWFGMSEKVIDIILSGELKYPSRKLIRFLRRELLSDRLSPFEGELHSQEKKIRGEEAGRMSPEEIVDMRWLNENVMGSIPPLSEFTEASQELIRRGGFLS